VTHSVCEHDRPLAPLRPESRDGWAYCPACGTAIARDFSDRPDLHEERRGFWYQTHGPRLSVWEFADILQRRTFIPLLLMFGFALFDTVQMRPPPWPRPPVVWQSYRRFWLHVAPPDGYRPQPW